jgi:hypothetical protein
MTTTASWRIATPVEQEPSTPSAERKFSALQPNGRLADKISFRCNCTNVVFGRAAQQTVVFGVILPVNE